MNTLHEEKILVYEIVDETKNCYYYYDFNKGAPQSGPNCNLHDDVQQICQDATDCKLTPYTGEQLYIVNQCLPKGSLCNKYCNISKTYACSNRERHCNDKSDCSENEKCFDCSASV